VLHLLYNYAFSEITAVQLLTVSGHQTPDSGYWMDNGHVNVILYSIQCIALH